MVLRQGQSDFEILIIVNVKDEYENGRNRMTKNVINCMNWCINSVYEGKTGQKSIK